MNSYQKAVEELKKMDEEYGDVWMMPPVRDSLLFALTEVGETIDAHMRTKPEYFRNRDFLTNGNEVYEEATDVAMMVIKAFLAHELILNQNDTDRLGTTLLNAVMLISESISAALCSDTIYSHDLLEIEKDMRLLIKMIENDMGYGYVGNQIAEKMNKTRAKILARQEEKKNV